jgi:hypothetical protein
MAIIAATTCIAFPRPDCGSQCLGAFSFSNICDYQGCFVNFAEQTGQYWPLGLTMLEIYVDADACPVKAKRSLTSHAFWELVEGVQFKDGIKITERAA